MKDELDGLDIQVLIEQGLLEKETVNRRTYYTVLPEGRELLDETIAVDAGTGDLGEKMPHKVGVELLWRWISAFERVDRVERYFHQDSETIFDVAGFDAEGDLIWVGEVEMASNNVDAVVDDYDKMAASDASAVWAFPSRTEGQDTIRQLAASGRLPSQVSGRAARSFSPFQQAVEAFNANGMTTIQTFRKLHEEVRE